MSPRKKCSRCNAATDELVRKNNKKLCVVCVDEVQRHSESNSSISFIKAADNQDESDLLSNEDGGCVTEAGNNCVISNLLSYVQFYLKRSANDNVKAVISRFYSQEEILEAKLLLWRFVDESVLGTYQARINSVSRSSHEADCHDIITAFQRIDAESIKIPKFGANNFDRVPKYSPEQVGDGALRDLMNVIRTLNITVQSGFYPIIQHYEILRDSA